MAACAACGSTGAVPRPFPTPDAPHAPAGAPERPPPGADGYSIAGTALRLRGAPYRDGGTDPSGFDCSGFIWYVFAQHGIRVPRTVEGQFGSGKPIGRESVEAGDLVFFAISGSAVSHVGMVIGADQFVHAPSSRGEVRVERLSSPYWSGRFVGARRVR
jgi:peptidoglycan DL-endopeptidase CwlO